MAKPDDPLVLSFVGPAIIVTILWNFFTYELNIRDNFLLCILNLYLPTIFSLIILLITGAIEFSLILPAIFVVPVAAYYYFKHLGYFAAYIFFINYLVFGSYTTLIISGIAVAAIILYKLKFRHIPGSRVEELGDISIGETIRIGMPLISHSGFSKITNYSEIPDVAIDPYTLENIHDLIMRGKEIVKCNSCGTYYDREVLRFYNNDCAIFGCSNSQT
ncbi:MAG: hypothetical protein CVT90_00770 [Candidatus Altiarchaeales archaeon HGW-Altiarchaeales-3]|nr:MAG: hypothetical protein CVT90_00770 [Candidatus Altiarchaeales archaeon HGW-Altiarchaeales-3]